MKSYNSIKKIIYENYIEFHLEFNKVFSELITLLVEIKNPQKRECSILLCVSLKIHIKKDVGGHQHIQNNMLRWYIYAINYFFWKKKDYLWWIKKTKEVRKQEWGGTTLVYMEGGFLIYFPGKLKENFQKLKKV